jgi:hypothetical protein
LAEFAKRRIDMPEIRTMKRSRVALRGSKSPMSEADEFAMAIAKARRSGVGLHAPKRSRAKTRLVLEREVARAKKPRRTARRRARAAATVIALERKGRKAAAPRSLARAARTSTAKRKPSRKAPARSSARKPVRRSRSRTMR